MNQKKGAKILGGFILLSIFLFTFVSAESCVLSASMVNQDPYPAIPGDYVDVLFQISGIDNSECNGAIFELVPSYPFSVDENDTTRILEGSSWTAKYKSEWTIPYSVRVDSDAFDGNATIKVNYGEESAFISKDFDIVIQDSRTAFDAVIQESTSSEVSIAIANIGKYTANSVVVRIPEQEGFKATGTDGQMVGNLDSGDYTIVSFSISSMVQRNMRTQDSGEDTKPNFQFDIYYTDALGERRIVNMGLPLQMTSVMTTEDGETISGFPGGKMRSNKSSLWSNWYLLIIFLVLGGTIFFLYKKYPKQTKEFYNKLRQRINGLFHKKKQSDNTSNIIPDWIKNAKEKEKKK